MIDLTALSDDDLAVLRVQVLTEEERRYTLATAPDRADQLARDYLTATGHDPGTDWTQPTGAHDAYPRGWTVRHGGKTWTSLTPANVWEPGSSGWREVVNEPDTWPEWVQPTGAHDAYQAGDRVTFEGSAWESLIDGNSWSPTAYPAGWKQLP